MVWDDGEMAVRKAIRCDEFAHGMVFVFIEISFLGGAVHGRRELFYRHFLFALQFFKLNILFLSLARGRCAFRKHHLNSPARAWDGTMYGYGEQGNSNVPPV